jgi:23S rRNA (guanosine2251-2'-O)-methyltransferase
MAEYIWGRNPVLETLQSSRRVKRVFIAQGQHDAPVLAAILRAAERRHVPVETVPRSRLDQLSNGGTHQGSIALVQERSYASVDDILENAHNKRQTPFVLILDAIQDINNLGSLMRTAEAAGVHGVVIPERRAAEVNATVVKTSAGATEHLIIAQETNLSRTIEYLQKQQIWVVGLAGEADTFYTKANLTGPLALVVGNEGKGISRIIREHCDLLIKLPMYGQINSLNAAVAGSIALYEALRQREAKGD